ncbi:cytochrome d ubiquinol oxidase subunit II [Nonomuraea sp. NEAU-A123]|uniref:cytochrome d ubiquinol oxidase subunit II n=1 Tax=Nonomuraea sp. NEAU-A123 TaxID=2839649 RepID=UPI001BE4B3C9|nr:cytochrome d ubiquinol oxidase subunit II [Nonomuraea sp. NEAU-A123]MBT2226582.1 cytochrome d ubiquinol oxidase subunit II [Nonomuraea sp. NEAU-A123]
MELTEVWFVAITVLWVGYFVLEGFDFGVGMMLPVVARNETERRVMIDTIGPVWDGNEVWLITAGGATFAAFPEWYASLFSGFYLPLLLILVALIVRGVGFEYRGKRDSVAWRLRWDAGIVAGSFVPALLWGIAFANIVRGVRLDADHEYVGTFWDLLNPYALLGGLTTLTLFATHGAVFLALKTRGEISRRAASVALKTGVAAAVLMVGFLAWTQIYGGVVGTVILAVFAVLAFASALGAIARGRQGWAFLLSAVAIGVTVISLFVVLHPNVLPSTINPAYSLTVENAAATPKTLGIMTGIAAFFLPLVVLYQSWTYWVFRHRVGAG